MTIVTVHLAHTVALYISPPEVNRRLVTSAATNKRRFWASKEKLQWYEKQKMEKWKLAWLGNLVS